MYPPVSQLAVRVRSLELGDTLGRAAEQVRASGGRGAPVAVSGHVLGVVQSADLAGPLASSPEEAKRLPVATLPLRPASPVPDYWTADRALEHLRREGADSAPVLDAAGRYVGMISSADLAVAVCGRLRPRSIGGMATPFGVYLTDGAVRGGVGNAALISAGIFIGGLHLVAIIAAVLLFGEAGWLARVPWVVALTQRLGLEGPQTLLMVAIPIFFALAFRFSHVAGFHAAEHQVVHAIEAGDDLRTAVIRAKPRVHPRCGTNLVVGLLLISLLWHSPYLRPLGDYGVIAALVLFLFTWRRLGSAAQQYVTTRPASDAQIRSGIRAGEELLAAYQTTGLNAPSQPWLRFWNMGICQVLTGFALLVLVVWILNHFVPVPGIELLLP